MFLLSNKRFDLWWEFQNYVILNKCNIRHSTTLFIFSLCQKMLWLHHMQEDHNGLCKPNRTNYSTLIKSYELFPNMVLK